MSYFDEVYLKRVNKFGTDLQQRVQNSKEREFEIFLSKSPNKVKVFKDNEEFTGVLQNKSSSEKEVTSYLLTSLSNNWDNGTIVRTEQLSNDLEQKWLVMHDDTYVSIGYSRYQVLELDMPISWIDNGIAYSELVHFSGSGANLRDKAVTSKFSIQFNISLAYKPNRILSLIMKTNSHIKKGIRILIEDEVWKVTGLDKVSVPGVSYVTLEEDYIDHMDDQVYADAPKLLDWNIQSNFGDKIELIKEKPTQIIFSLFYGDSKREEDIVIKIKDKNIVEYKDSNFIGKKRGRTTCVVCLKESPDISKEFSIEVVNTENSLYSIIGPNIVKVLGIAKYQIVKPIEEEVEISSKNNNFSIVSKESDSLVIKGENIGADSIILSVNNEIKFEQKIDIESIWLEG